jgi:hypothetical protein
MADLNGTKEASLRNSESWYACDLVIGCWFDRNLEFTTLAVYVYTVTDMADVKMPPYTRIRVGIVEPDNEASPRRLRPMNDTTKYEWEGRGRP